MLGSFLWLLAKVVTWDGRKHILQKGKLISSVSWWQRLLCVTSFRGGQCHEAGLIMGMRVDPEAERYLDKGRCMEVSGLSLKPVYFVGTKAQLWVEVYAFGRSPR